jgi:hypothetical protein
MWRIYVLVMALGLAFAVGVIFLTAGWPAGEVL